MFDLQFLKLQNESDEINKNVCDVDTDVHFNSACVL